MFTYFNTHIHTIYFYRLLRQYTCTDFHTYAHTSTHVYILIRPFTSTCFQSSMPIHALYMITYFYAHIRPIYLYSSTLIYWRMFKIFSAHICTNVYILLRLHTGSYLQSSTPIYVHTGTYISTPIYLFTCTHFYAHRRAKYVYILLRLYTQNICIYFTPLYLNVNTYFYTLIPIHDYIVYKHISILVYIRVCPYVCTCLYAFMSIYLY
jgi:hypothetical protein